MGPFALKIQDGMFCFQKCLGKVEATVCQEKVASKCPLPSGTPQLFVQHGGLLIPLPLEHYSRALGECQPVTTFKGLLALM